MIKKQVLEYYDWDDVERFICDELNIFNDQFYEYHHVVGGDHKDLWKVWSTINRENLKDGVYSELYLGDIDHLMTRIVKEYGDWVECLRPILIKLRAEIGESVMIYYW